MRPMRFEPWLRDLLQGAGDPGVAEVRTQEEAAFSRSRYGLTVTTAAGATVILQIVATSATGDDYAAPEEIVEGTAPDPVESAPIGAGTVRLADLEARLAGLILSSGSPEVDRLERYSTREGKQAVPYGLTVWFHSGAKIYVYVLHAVPKGRSWETQQEFQVPAEV